MVKERKWLYFQIKHAVLERKLKYFTMKTKSCFKNEVINNTALFFSFPFNT